VSKDQQSKIAQLAARNEELSSRLMQTAQQLSSSAKSKDELERTLDKLRTDTRSLDQRAADSEMRVQEQRQREQVLVQENMSLGAVLFNATPPLLTNQTSRSERIGAVGCGKGPRDTRSQLDKAATAGRHGSQAELPVRDVVHAPGSGQQNGAAPTRKTHPISGQIRFLLNSQQIERLEGTNQKLREERRQVILRLRSGSGGPSEMEQ
jgi:hypothetical protein